MLRIAHLSKRYGETVALADVSIECEPGTVHTILGENGSGKSTLVKLLAGIVRPDAGTITVDGVPLRASGPAACLAAGIATVFQEVLIAPDRDVIDNVLLGIDAPFVRRVPRRERRSRVEAALHSFARTTVPLDVPAGRLPLAARQLVVLARALVRRPRILVLDEVTAALDFADRDSVFALMERLAREGVLMLFITHRMDEVMRLSRRISVLRSGRLVATLDRAGTSPDALLALMAPETARELAHA